MLGCHPWSGCRLAVISVTGSLDVGWRWIAVTETPLMCRSSRGSSVPGHIRSCTMLIPKGQTPRSSSRRIARGSSRVRRMLHLLCCPASLHPSAKPASFQRVCTTRPMLSTSLSVTCRCGTPAYSSATKFNSGTGWPSFYDKLEGVELETGNLWDNVKSLNSTLDKFSKD